MDIRSSIEQTISERIEQLSGERSPDMAAREKELFDSMEKLVNMNEGQLREILIQQTDGITDCLAENNRYFYIAGLEDGIRIMKLLCKL